MDPQLIAIGMAIGIAVTAPLGPVNLTVIRSALRAGMGGEAKGVRQGRRAVG